MPRAGACSLPFAPAAAAFVFGPMLQSLRGRNFPTRACWDRWQKREVLAGRICRRTFYGIGFSTGCRQFATGPVGTNTRRNTRATRPPRRKHRRKHQTLPGRTCPARPRVRGLRIPMHWFGFWRGRDRAGPRSGARYRYRARYRARVGDVSPPTRCVRRTRRTSVDGGIVKYLSPGLRAAVPGPRCLGDRSAAVGPAEH
jgi:hypothetical protein